MNLSRPAFVLDLCERRFHVEEGHQPFVDGLIGGVHHLAVSHCARGHVAGAHEIYGSARFRNMRMANPDQPVDGIPL
jgi:hypothetical protein